MTPTATKRYTIDDLLAMPDDGVERYIINGELRECRTESVDLKMTVRNWWHSDVMSYIAASLVTWSKSQPKPRGRVFCGEAGVIFPMGANDTFGLDVTYISPELEASRPKDVAFIEGVPTLCVEILSQTDSYIRINEKTQCYLDAGVAIVWIVDPYDQNVRVFTDAQHATIYNINQQIPEHPAMPGFSPKVMEFFD